MRDLLMTSPAQTNYCYRGNTASSGLLGLAFSFVFVGLPCTIQAQGVTAFQNLNFEAANLASIPTNQSGGYVPISQAMPGWTGYLGNIETTQIGQNGASLGAAQIDIFGPHYAIGLGGIIDGKYTAVLQAGGSGQYVAATLAQTGLVPVGTASLQMKIGASETGFAVSLAGQSLNMIPLQTFANYTLFGGNIPANLAGQAANLSISSLPTATDHYNAITLDDITFSASPVPEPGSGWLLLAGGATLGIVGRFRARAKRSRRSTGVIGASEPHCSDS